MDELDPPAGLAVTRETIERSNPSFPMRLPEGTTAWKAFESTWTPKERSDEVGDWTRERAGEFIQATAAMVAGFFESMEDAGSKSLVSLAFRLHGLGIDRLDYQARLRGSKFGVAHEDFKGSLLLSDSAGPPAGDPPSSVPDSRVAELSHIEEGNGPLPKIAPVWSDREGCLDLWDRLRSALGDSPGSASAQDAALLLVHFEHLSQKNAQTMDSRLDGLSRSNPDGSELDLGKDAFSATRRVEERIALSPSTRTKM